MKTSFGQMEIILKQDNKPKVEYLVFESNGRPHQHKDHESFFVLKGRGKVFVGETEVSVEPGSLVVIPPNTSHWMAPHAGEGALEGLLWYHDEPLSLHSV